MTAACFFRYAWIAPDRFEALLPRSAAIERLAEHVRLGPSLADALPAGALRSGAIACLRAFASAPLLDELPSASLIRSAARWSTDRCESAAERLAGWCLALRERLADCVDTAADDDRDAAFLDMLATTDFPVLLLWSNPDLGRYLFACDGGAVRPSRSFAADPKARRKAAAAALRYALGTFGRFGPRGGWIGSGFAVAAAKDGPARIARGDERLRIEPDIAWAARNWFPDDPGGIVPGEDAWMYVRRKLRETAAPARLAIVERLQAMADALGDGAWSFADVDAFGHDAAACLAATIDADRWRTDPHRWWPTRTLGCELRVRSDLVDACDRLYAAARADFPGAGAPTGPSMPGAGPFPLRSAGRDPAAVIATAEEFTDWALRSDSIRGRAGPFLPEAGPRSAAIVIHAEGGRARYKLHEPNPRRTADIAVRHFDGSPHYLACDADSIPIAPPEELSDQRLLRRVGKEVAVDRVPDGRNAMFRFPLTGPATGAQIAREMASPRYALAPDLLPVLFDEGSARVLSFGALDPASRVWILQPQEARALTVHTKSPGAFAAFYRLELDAALGSPTWVSVLVEGRMSRMPTGSPVAFRWLLHACRTATTPIVVRAAAYHDLPPLLADADGVALACEIYAAMPGEAVPLAAEPDRHPFAPVRDAA